MPNEVAESPQRTERLINLLAVLINSVDEPLSSSEIRSRVPGYNEDDKAGRQALKRDFEALEKVGVTVEKAFDEGVTRYSIEQNTFLPDVAFTPEEAYVLQLAGQVSSHHKLGIQARRGWNKLAAFATDLDREETLPLVSHTELWEVDSKDLAHVLNAINRHKALSFMYRRDPAATPEERHLEPWGIASHNERQYLVGFDTDREATRTFRLIRIEQATISGTATRPRPEDFTTVAAEAMASLHPRVTATVAVTPGAARAFVDRGERLDDTTVRFSDVDRDWLVRNALSYCESVTVLEPADLRHEVKERLQHIVDTYSGVNK
ncbi:MAG: WYL domain-containing protein [Corynebacterium glucuronolyticum]|nr:WYL domain-containing protein [Corynebacterium glucuronolyticum]MDD7586531.1 WYL domain-containing protein [Mycobacteriaceae bacterium]MDY5834853.1 WYL domain-containing protein [Corynebacterium glucuronolyticum]